MADIRLLDVLQDQNPWWAEPRARRALRYPTRRDFQLDLRRRLGRQDRRACLVMGPRQVGKTIGLLQLADDLLDAGLPSSNLLYFDFSDERLTMPVSAREIERVRPVGFQAEAPRILLLDEIRFAPNWDRWLKQAVDAGVGRIIATDSAASVLRAGTRESGLGRWDELLIEGLSFSEFTRLHAAASSRDNSLGGSPAALRTPSCRKAAIRPATVRCGSRLGPGLRRRPAARPSQPRPSFRGSGVPPPARAGGAFGRRDLVLSRGRRTGNRFRALGNSRGIRGRGYE